MREGDDLNGWIDLHSHILFALDDGSSSLEESLDMAWAAYRQGTSRMAATPHCNVPGEEEMTLRIKTVQTRLSKLKAALAQRDIPLKLYAGMELLCRDNLPELLEQEAFLTLAGSRYLLIEFSFDAPLYTMEQAALLVQRKGLVPIIAHPERYDAVQRTPGYLGEWFANGFLMQVNKGSILGRFGPKPQAAAAALLERGLVHLVASDTHGAFARTPDLSEAYDAVARFQGAGYAQALFCRNPRRILNDAPVLTIDEL